MAHRDVVLSQLDRILGSEVFKGSERSRSLLRFIVERTADGQAGRLKEYTIGAHALGRGDSFDPRTDPIVRAEASRLRHRLELYYATEGKSDSLLITLPKGGYAPLLEARPAESDPPKPVTVPVWPWKVATFGLALALVLALWAPWRNTQQRRELPVHLDVNLGTGQFIGSEVGADMTVSSDGNWLVFVALDSEGRSHLFRRRLDRAETTEIPGTEGARNPFFSAKGSWVGFWSDGKLKKTLVDGGSPITLCEATDLLGGSWGDDGTIVAVLDSTSRLFRVPAEGGAPTVLADFGKASLKPRWPQVLPGEQAVLFTSSVGPASDSFDIDVLHIPDHKIKTLVHGGTYGRYLSNGQLVYVNRGSLFAAPFGLDKLEVQGTPTRVLDDVAYSSSFGYAQFDISRGGTLIYRRNPGKGSLTFAWLDRYGNTNGLLTTPGLYRWPRLSPDGRQLAFSKVEGEQENLWTFELQQDKLTRVTAVDNEHLGLVWSPDSKFLIFGGREGIFWRRAGRFGDAKSLLRTGKVDSPWSVAPDGTRLAFSEMNPQTGFDLWTVPIEILGDELRAGKPELFLQTRASEVYPAFSPDGRRLAYGSNESGAWQVYVRAFPDNGSVVQVSKNGGRIPAWSPNGRELLFRTDEHRIMAAEYRLEKEAFLVEPPRPWSEMQLANTGILPSFSLAPDGNRAAVLIPAASPAERQAQNDVTLLLNFFAEIQRRIDDAHQR
jgi:eukaryotic-like serine/threonine-protein kinase